MNIDALLQKLPFYHKQWFQFLYFLIKNFIDDDCQQKSASLTYTTMLSIVPILTVLLVMISSIPAMAAAKEQIQALIYKNLLPSSSLQVTQYFNDFAEKSSNLTAIGVVFLFITAILTLTTIQRAFNQIWRVEQKAMGWMSILQYWAIVTLGPLVLGTAFIVSSTMQSLSFFNQQIAGYEMDWSFWLQAGSIAMTVLGFVAMYWLVPRCKVKFLYALIAGVVVAITFEILKQTFGTIMTNFTSYQKVYGVFAAVPIFLFWIYLSWNLILLGVEISYTLTVFETREVFPRHPLLSLMDMLNVVYRAHLKGQTVSELELRNVLGRKEVPHWYRYTRYLQDNHLIALTDSEHYVLKRQLDNYTFWDFYQNLPYPLPHTQDLKQIAEFEPWMQDWVGKLATSEAMLKQNFSISMAEIFNNMPPRKDPIAENSQKNGSLIDKAKAQFTSGMTSEQTAVATEIKNDGQKQGLSGGQVSDLTHDNQTIEQTQQSASLPVTEHEVTPSQLQANKTDANTTTALPTLTNDKLTADTTNRKPTANIAANNKNEGISQNIIRPKVSAIQQPKSKVAKQPLRKRDKLLKGVKNKLLSKLPWMNQPIITEEDKPNTL